MKDRIVPQEEIEKRYIEFCKDIGAIGDTKDVIDKYLEEHNLIVKRSEDAYLIWFEQIEDNEVKYYSEPIEKFVAEPKKEMVFYVKADAPLGMIRVPKSAMPLYQFSKKRKGKIPPNEEKRYAKTNYMRDYQRHIDWAYDFSVFGYIVYDGKSIRYPTDSRGNGFIYKGGDEEDLGCYSDFDLLRELLSDKERYTWYELGEDWFIVRNANKKEYQYLADEESQEIKLAKVVGDKIVLEDIVKDAQTLKVEKEIDKYLSKADGGVIDKYIRYRDNCFEVLKTENIPVRFKHEMFELFPKSNYRTEGRYQKFETDLTLSEIESVVKSGNKYKWFEEEGVLYITSKRGNSELRIIMGDYIYDYFSALKVYFEYNDSPKSMVIEFIENEVWDGDKIIEKYNCAQECIDNIKGDLIHYGYIEKNEDGLNKCKISKEREDLSYLMFSIEHELHL